MLRAGLEHSENTNHKSQSAMEYLMTYGWAILIIAVVLGAIYSLGLFNGASLAPRSQPGSCEVLRPNGALTTQYISLAGACTNELPQYVAKFSGNGYVNANNLRLPISNSIASANATISIWFYMNSNDISGVQSLFVLYQNSNAIQLEQDYTGYATPSSLLLSQDSRGFGDGEWLIMPQRTWVNVVAFMNSTNFKYYVNGVYTHLETFPAMYQATFTTPSLGIGGAPGGSFFNGSIANVQVYNTTLDANSVKALYQEGIGGAPINLQNLVAWYPLNGDSNDYSGNLYNGVQSKVVFSNQWLSGYTVP